LTIVANMVTAASFLQGDELAGAGRVRSLAAVSWASSVLGLAVSLTASLTEAFARPLAMLVGSATRYGAQSGVLVRAYAAETAESGTDPSAVGAEPD
jgi:hypothetical protein